MIQKFDDILKAYSQQRYETHGIYGERQTGASTAFGYDAFVNVIRGFIKNTRSSLPSGITSFIPSTLYVNSTVSSDVIMLAEMLDMGSLNIATPTFTDGSAWGTKTELGASINMASAILMEVTAALNATPGTITVTYVDQDGNTAETTASITPTASAVAGTGGYVPLNTGDWGARDITTATRTGGTTPSGTIRFWGVRPLVTMTPKLGTAVTSPGIMKSLLTAPFNMQKLGTSTVLRIIGSANAGAMMGNLVLLGDD